MSPCCNNAAGSGEGLDPRDKAAGGPKMRQLPTQDTTGQRNGSEPSEMHYSYTTALYRHSTWNNKQKMRLFEEKTAKKCRMLMDLR